MIINGKLTHIQGESIKVKVDDDFSVKRAMKLANGEQPTVEIIIQDGRQISPDQRKKIFAMIRDISEWTGYMPQEAEDWMKYNYRFHSGKEAFSLSDTSVENASEFIKYLIDFCIKNHVPLKDKLWQLSEDISLSMFLCLKYRSCAICGRHGDIHHQDKRVGMGRNRNTYDHRNSTFICLCRKHHTEVHTMTFEEFKDKYHILPIKLNEEAILDLKLMTKKRLNEVRGEV